MFHRIRFSDFLHDISEYDSTEIGALAYHPHKESIIINLTNDDKNIEREIEGVLSHETVHGVLCKKFSWNISIDFDNLEKHVGVTPISFPQSCSYNSEEVNE